MLSARRVVSLPFLVLTATVIFVFVSLHYFSVMTMTLYNPGMPLAHSELLVTQTRRNLTSMNSTTTATLRITTKAPQLPMLYVITPTYKRQEQIPEITRLAQTLMNVPRIHWLVADDTLEANKPVQGYLNQTGISYTYLLTPMPERYRNKSGAKPKGVANRNGAVEWIRSHASDGVFYFADDDNSYDIRIFEEIRWTREVSMFPVGLVTSFGLSTPIVRDGRFVGWYDGWTGGRKYPVDMAGFAVSVPYLFKYPKASMPYSPGYEEDGFLKSLNVDVHKIEFLATNCTKVYVWHTKTRPNGLFDRSLLKPQYNNTNLQVLKDNIMLKPPKETTKKS